VDNNNKVPRSVHFADFLVIFAGLFHNILSAIQAFTEELMEIAVYNANRNSEVSKVWEKFSNDLEKIEEDTDGR
jgi:type I site-specific restriction-modification system R (restriction) subunit